jgi:hypothetical protein
VEKANHDKIIKLTQIVALSEIGEGARRAGVAKKTYF